jgi:Protein of unknown function (DUF3606)
LLWLDTRFFGEHTEEPAVPSDMTAPTTYEPPDPTQIEAGNPRALRFWAGTLNKPPEQIRAAVAKVGPLLEDVKRELGIAGE